MGRRSFQGILARPISARQQSAKMLTLLQTTFVDPKALLQERDVEAEDITGDSFVALDLHKGATALSGNGSTGKLPVSSGPGVDALALQESIGQSKPLDVLRFVPYYFRANRKGRGHMRVGLRQWHK